MKNMQDLGKIELRFICYQNWDNSEKMRLASNLNAGRVDGVDAVVESVSFEYIPLSASIYKQTQEYSGTSTEQTQQQIKKSKTVKLKISVNDKNLAKKKVEIQFLVPSIGSSTLDITLKDEKGNILATSTLDNVNNNGRVIIDKVNTNGLFYKDVNMDLSYIIHNTSITLEVTTYVGEIGIIREIILK
ncbi:MAG: hypothetical protein QW156_05205 [Candidatus Aenigmatarchaeota archaeon]